MERSRVRLPATVQPPFTVYVNGVAQREGVDFEVVGGALEFQVPLQKEGKLSMWRWLLGAFGIGSYGKNDQVDVAWSAGGRSRIAHALDIEPTSSLD